MLVRKFLLVEHQVKVGKQSIIFAKLITVSLMLTREGKWRVVIPIAMQIQLASEVMVGMQTTAVAATLEIQEEYRRAKCKVVEVWAEIIVRQFLTHS